MHNNFKLGMALTALLVAAQAGAAVGGRIDIDSVTWSIADLTPNDGKPIWMTWSSGAPVAGGAVSTWTNGVAENNWSSTDAGTDPFGQSVQHNAMAASVAVTGRGAPGTHAVSVQASGGPGGGDVLSTHALGNAALNFALSNNTSVTFTVNVHLTGEITDDEVFEEVLAGSAWLSVGYVSDNATINLLTSRRHSLDRYDTLTVTYYNTIGYSVPLTASFGGYLDTTTYVTQVPEPDAAWMFLLGGGVLAGATRFLRRRA